MRQLIHHVRKSLKKASQAIVRHPIVTDIIPGHARRVVHAMRRTREALRTDKVAKFLYEHHRPLTVIVICFALVAFLLNYQPITAATSKVIFYPTSCSGTWEGISRLGHTPEERTALAEVSAQTSTRLAPGVASDADCTDFGVASPTGMMPVKAVIKLSLSLTDPALAPVQNVNISIPDSDTPQTLEDILDVPVSDATASASPDSAADSGGSSESAPAETPTENNPETPPSEPAPAPTPAPEPTPAPAPEPSSDPVTSFLHKVFSTKIALAQELAPESAPAPAPSSEPAPVSPLPSDSAPAETPAENNSESTPSTALPTETPSESVLETDTTASSDATAPETAIETAPELQFGTIDDVFRANVIDLMQVQYSTDGETWINAGIVNGVNIKAANFDITDVLESDSHSLENITVRLHPVNDPTNASYVYINSVAIEVDYKDIPELPVPPTIVLKGSSLIDGEENFNSNDVPTFTVTDPELTVADVLALVDEGKADVVKDTAGILKESEKSDEPGTDTETSPFNIIQNAITPLIDTVKESIEKTADTVVSMIGPAVAYAEESSQTISDAVILNSSGEATNITVTITTVVVDGVEKQQIAINKPDRQFRPGRYTLKITLQTPQVIIISEQDFNWGVLAMNMDKSLYHSGEKAYLQMGVLDDHGHTLCKADLKLSITSPSGSVSELSTDAGTVKRSEDCAGDTVVDVPDYSAYFTPTQIGDYEMRLTATTQNGIKSIVDRLRVVGPVNFEVERSGPTRIYPVSTYPVTMRITSPTNWSGTITETVPANFEITQPLHSLQYSNVAIEGELKKISWNVSLTAGEETAIGYYFDAPDISPEFYLLGPLTFYEGSEDVFHESREWQIASDATCTGSTTGSWNTGGNWTGCSGAGGIPGAGDNITINTGVVITMNANSAVLGTITVNGTLWTSDGTARNLSGTTLTIGSAGKVASTTSGGTAAASTITLSGTTGTLLTITSGGIFTASTSTVTLTGNGSNTVNGGTGTFTGSNKLNNLTVNITGVTKTLGAAIEMGGTTTITLGTLDTNSTSNYALTTGALSIASSAAAILKLNASTFTLNATSGTLFTKGAAGVFTAGTSTVVFASDGTVTLTSNVGLTFNNITFSPTLTANRVYTFGTTAPTINGNISVTPTAASSVQLTVTLASSFTVGATKTILVQPAGSATATLDCNTRAVSSGFVSIQSNGTMSFSSGTLALTATTGTLITRNGGTFTAGTSVVTIKGNGSNTINSGSFTGSNAFYSVTLNITGVTKTQGGDVELSSAGTLTLTLGTWDTSSSGNYALTVGKINLAASASAILVLNASTVTLNATSGTLFTKGTTGVFTAGTSTVVFNPDAAVTLTTNTATFNNVTLSPTITADRTYTFTANTVNGNLSIIPAAASSARLTVTMSGNFTGSATTTVRVQPSGSATATMDFNSRTVSTGFVDIESGGTMSFTSGTLTLTGTTGTLITRNGGTFTSGTSTVSVTGNGSNTLNSGTFTGSNDFYNLTINITGVTKTLGADIEMDVAGTLTVTLGTLDTSASGNYAITAGKINIASSAAAILKANASTITLDAISGALFTRGASGVFTQGTSNLTVTSASGTPSLLSGTLTVHILTINSAATVINAGAVLTTDSVAGNGITITSGVFNDGGSQMVVGTSGALTIGATGTLCLGGTAASTSASCDSAGTSTSATATTMPAGFTTFNLDAASTVIYLANAATTVSTTPTYGNLYLRPFITGSSRTYTITGALSVAGNFDTTPLAATVFSLSVTMTGAWNVAGDFEVSGGGAGPAKTIFSTGTNFALNAARITVGDALSSATTFTANASAIGVTGTSGTLFALKAGATFTANTSTVTLSGNGSATINSGSPTFNTLVSSGTGTKTLGAGITINTNLTISGGTFDASTFLVTGSGTNALSVTNATLDVNASTFAGNYTSFETRTMNTGSIVEYSLNGTQTVDGTLAYVGLTISTGGTKSLNGTTTATGTIAINTATLDTVSGSNYTLNGNSMDIQTGGILLAQNSAITLTGNWTNAGTFTAGNSNVTLNGGTTATVTGTTTFYDFTITHSAAKQVNFATASTPIFHVTNAFTVTGHAAALIKLYSDSTPTKWQFHPTGTASVDYADIKDGGCQPGAITINTNDSIDPAQNNDSCWSFSTIPVITFSISDNSIGFGALTTANARYATGDLLGSSSDSSPAHTLSLTTNSAAGYSLTYYGSLPTSGANTIAAANITNDADGDPGTTPAFGLSLSTDGASTIDSGYDHNATAGLRDWKWIPNTTTQVVSNSGPVSSTETISAYYLGNISTTTPAGEYSNSITYILTGTF